MPPRFLPVLASFLALLSVPLQAADERPNIVLFLCDDLRADSLGFTGHPFVQTPNVDSLAQSGSVFYNAFATTAICMTSRANILTGQYAARSGIRHSRELRERTLTEEEMQRTYLSRLREVGYKLGYVGKWHVGKPPIDFFDHDFAYEGQGRFYEGDGGEHLSARLAAQAEEMIQYHDGAHPFFLCVGFKAPHVQDGRTAPFYIYDEERTGELYVDEIMPEPILGDSAFFDQQPDFLKRSMNRERWGQRFGTPELYQDSVKGYYRLVSGIDMAVGRVLRALEAREMRKNTIIIFTSDHGVFLGDRGLASKFLPHELSIRIPLILQDPRRSDNAGQFLEQMALTIDLAPTMLDLAGADVPAWMQGRSLVPVMDQEEEALTTWRTDSFYDHEFLPLEIPATEAVRTDRWKYIRYTYSDPLYEELYDLNADPFETRNLIGNPEYEFIHQELEARWEALREEAKGNP